MTLRQFEPTSVWSDKDGLLTERAHGYHRSLFDFIGASAGVVPAGSLGGDGVSTTTFYREDGTFAVPAYPTGAAPTSSIGTAAVNGTAVTFLRSDAAPALSLSITPTWTGAHTFSAGLSAAGLVSTSSLSTTTSATIGTGFGCNGKTAQTSATANAALTATAGVLYTATEQGMLNDLKALVNQIRAALVADGVMV